MRMDHALAVAAGQAPGPEQILSVAGRLTRDGEPGPALSVRGSGGMGALPAPAGTPDNLGTLRSCQGLLSRTLQMLG
jgi:hypothetical protein